MVAGGGPVLVHEHSARRPLPLWKIILISLPWLALQFSWSAEFGVNTPFMLSLGLSKGLATLTWAAGPVSGLVVQPIAGRLSDQCTSRLGRRRPFIIGGMIVSVCMQFLYAWSLWIGRGLGDEGCSRGWALGIAIISFWVMDCSNNVLQTPLRAIVADLAHETQQELGQSLVSLWSALGSVGAFLFSFFIDPIKYIRQYFLLASFMLFTTCTAACFIANETPLPLPVENTAPPLLKAAVGGTGSDSSGSGDEEEEEEEDAETGGEGESLSPSAGTQPPKRRRRRRDGGRGSRCCAPLRALCSPCATCGAATVDAFGGIAEGVRTMPKAMRINCLVQFLTWACWFTYMPNWGAWMGQYVYGGHPADPAGCHPAAGSNASLAAIAAAADASPLSPARHLLALGITDGSVAPEWTGIPASSPSSSRWVPSGDLRAAAAAAAAGHRRLAPMDRRAVSLGPRQPVADHGTGRGSGGPALSGISAPLPSLRSGEEQWEPQGKREHTTGHTAGHTTAAAMAATSDPAHDSADRFTDGINKGSLGQALAAFLQFVFSMFTPWLSRRFGLKLVYAAYMLVFVATFFAMALLPTRSEHGWAPDVGVFLMALTGIPLTATNVFPFSLVGRLYRGDPRIGLYMGALNIFIVLPQLLDTAYIGTIADEYGWNRALLVGACWSVLAFLSVFLLRESEREAPGGFKELFTPRGEDDHGGDDEALGAAVVAQAGSVQGRSGAALVSSQSVGRLAPRASSDAERKRAAQATGYTPDLSAASSPPHAHARSRLSSGSSSDTSQTPLARPRRGEREGEV